MKLPLLLFLALLGSSGALAQDTGLARCRAIADAAARLACYDALPLTGADAKANANAREAAGESKPNPHPEQFGLEEKLAPSLVIDHIDSTVAGHFDGWAPNSIIRLANGQVWRVSDTDSRFYDLESPKVTITRGALSAFYFSLDGDNHTVKVRRVE